MRYIGESGHLVLSRDEANSVTSARAQRVLAVFGRTDTSGSVHVWDHGRASSTILKILTVPIRRDVVRGKRFARAQRNSR